MQAGSVVSADSNELLPGTVLFGAYEIVSELGSGGMSRVYCAKHRDLGELRAIKIVRRDEIGVGAEDTLVSEAKALIKINNDAVVRCHELLRDDTRLYLVMEYVEGPSLHRLLSRGPLPDDETLALHARVLCGLASIHAAGVVHRDLSPGNIVLPDGQPERAKIVDFGLATATVGDGRRAFQGNPAYASPEQFGLFGGRVDLRSDLYSLGLVLGEATVGEPLDAGPTIAERKALRQRDVRLPDYVADEVRRAVEPLLRPKPADRPESVDAAIRAASPAHVSGDSASSANRRGVFATIMCGSAITVGVASGVLLWLLNNTSVLGTPSWVPSKTHSSPPATAPVPNPAAATPPTSSPTSAVKPSPVAVPPTPIPVTRADAMAAAERLASFEWSPDRSNLEANCPLKAPYHPSWQPGERVRGIAYSWGGIDGPDEFSSKLRQGFASGSHAYHGVARCTAGIDCSGFVTYCWGWRGRHAFTTATLSRIADPVPGFVGDQLRPGDALNWAGKHVMLFGGYQQDGRPILFEAAGGAGRVVRRTDVSWSRLRPYKPMRLRSMVG